MSADENERHIAHVPVVGHLEIELMRGEERVLALQTEHEHDRVHPVRELHLGRAALISNEKQIGLSVDLHLFLEATALGRLLLDVGTGEEAMHQRGLAAARRAQHAQLQVGHAAAQRPLLAVDERVLDVDNVLTDLMLQVEVADRVDQVVDRVDVRVDALEALDLFANEERVGHLLLHVELLRVGRGGGYGGGGGGEIVVQAG